MLRILGSARTLCDGLTRRNLLQAGGLGLMGLGLDRFLGLREAQASADVPGFGRASNCILIYLYGAPSQLETFDMKPDAPLEVRGTMKPIPSVLPGLDVCEYLPHTSRVMDRVSVVRSITHPYPIHGVAYATTGVPAIDVGMELSPFDTRHHPYFGSVVQHVDQLKGRRFDPNVPQNVALPFPFSTQRTGEVFRAGPYASFLGASFNPTWTEFEGKASRSVYKTLRDMKYDVHDPYVGCTPESSFRLSATQVLPDMSIDRLNRRRSLLQQFDDRRRELGDGGTGRAMSKNQDLAFSLITSSKVAEALDVRREPHETRDLYGMTLFGQACLAARRMVEAGTRLVSVFWDEYGLAGDAWDTHWNHYPRMVDQLLPGFDLGFSGLILDLERRGLLDDTLVAVLSDHGRTPKLNNAEGGGRDHWSQVYSLAFAGGGIKKGNVVGKSDSTAGEPADRPVSPKDLLATMYHLLGIDPHTYMTDQAGQLVPLVPETNGVIPELIA